MGDHWSHFADSLNLWEAPLRPSEEDVVHFGKQLSPNSRTLLLGVTPELQRYATVAVDNNMQAVRANSPLAIYSDWANLPFEEEFDAIIGDGCLNVFQGGSDLFFKQMKKALKRQGKLILRIFTSPEKKENLADVLKDKDKMGFDAFQLRVTNAMANSFVQVKERYLAIKPVWDHPKLNIYQDSSLIYYNPKLSELPAWNDIQFSSSYELAERCPIVTWQFSKK